MPASTRLRTLRKRRDRLLGEVGQSLDRGEIGAALESRDEDVVQQPRARRGAHARGGAQTRAAQRDTAEEERGVAVAQRARGALDAVARDGGGCDAVRARRDAGRFVPLAIGGHDQRGDLPGRRERRFDRRDGVTRDVLRAAHRTHPARDRIRERDDVAGERRVGGEVPARVVADHVQERRARASRVVEVGDAVGEAGAEVEQRHRRAIGEARVAVGRARAHAFEEREHGAHARDAVERRDERHLGGARIGEADVDARRHGTPDQRFRPIHRTPCYQAEKRGRP